MHIRIIGRDGGDRWGGGEAWDPADARDAWWEALPDASWLSSRRARLRAWGTWLFANGGISVVFLLGLMLFAAFAWAFEAS